MHLARLLRLDEVTAVSVPTIEQETARDLVRAREDSRGDLMRARHRLSKLLLRHGRVYSDGKAWTVRHDAWLRAQHLDARGAQLTLDSDYDTVLAVTARRARLDAAILDLAAVEFAESARRTHARAGRKRLGSLRSWRITSAFRRCVFSVKRGACPDGWGIRQRRSRHERTLRRGT